MTANITQQVRRRHTNNFSFTSYRLQPGVWRTRRASRHRGFSSLKQRGSVSQSTLTIAFGALMLISMTVLGFVYLQQVFGTASQGADIQALETEVIELREQQKTLELEGASLRSIQAVEEKVNELNLVTSSNVAYLSEITDRVALTAP